MNESVKDDFEEAEIPTNDVLSSSSNDLEYVNHDQFGSGDDNDDDDDVDDVDDDSVNGSIKLKKSSSQEKITTRQENVYMLTMNQILIKLMMRVINETSLINSTGDENGSDAEYDVMNESVKDDFEDYNNCNIINETSLINCTGDENGNDAEYDVMNESVKDDFEEA
eukprot:Pgem_evm2s6395